MVREELETKFANTNQAIIPGDYLALEAHWADIIDLVFTYDCSGAAVPGRSRPSTSYKIIAVDCCLLGNGDVVGSGSEILVIGRVNQNNFVPLHRIQDRDPSPPASVGCLVCQQDKSMQAFSCDQQHHSRSTWACLECEYPKCCIPGCDAKSDKPHLGIFMC